MIYSFEFGISAECIIRDDFGIIACLEFLFLTACGIGYQDLSRRIQYPVHCFVESVLFVDIEFFQRGASVECPFPYVFHILGYTDGFQALASFKCTVADRLHSRVQNQFLDVGPSSVLGSDFLHSLGDCDRPRIHSFR